MHVRAVCLAALTLGMATAAHAQPQLIAVARIDSSVSDKAGQTAGALEDGLAGNLLGGTGSGLAFAGGHRFIALPDRGPNAKPYNTVVDNTTSYVPRFHTFDMTLVPSAPGAGLAFTVTPELVATTLLSSPTPLVYGNGAAAGLPAGAPALNSASQFYFSGRSDNFDPAANSANSANGRLDAEGVRLTGNDLYLSDEYGPVIYRFDAHTGLRTGVITLPSKLAVARAAPVGEDEDKGNTQGRTGNKGMEGLAVTPDGKTLVGAMQSPLLQDGGVKAGFTRLVQVDITSGTTREYAYPLDNVGTAETPKYIGISEIVAINTHEFLVEERDGKGLGDGSAAKAKRIYRIDLAQASDVSAVQGEAALKEQAVAKTLCLDIVAAIGAAGITPDQIPAKIEGMTFGPDITSDGQTLHTLWLASDNDFGTEPNMVFVFALSDTDLPGYVAAGLPDAP